MKINPKSIILSHLETLRNEGQNRTSIADPFLFFGFPIIIGAICYRFNISASKDIYNISVTFYGIFIALLLNIQVAIFNIFIRIWNEPNDSKSNEIQRQEMRDRNKLLLQLNSNISYLVLISIFTVPIMVLFFFLDWKKGIAPALTALIYTHFLLTLLMVVKRSHALFYKEYADHAPS